MKTKDSEIGRMEALARNISQAVALISQHMENIRQDNDSDLPTDPNATRGAGGLTLEGEAPRASGHVYIYAHIMTVKNPLRPRRFGLSDLNFLESRSYIHIYIYIYNILGSSARFARAEAYALIIWEYITGLYYRIILLNRIIFRDSITR